MKKTLLAFALVVASVTGAAAQYGTKTTPSYGTGSNSNNHYVRPHTTQQGTNVPGHYQTNPNNTQRDNYGTRPNVNPYTGATGTRTPGY